MPGRSDRLGIRIGGAILAFSVALMGPAAADDLFPATVAGFERQDEAPAEHKIRTAGYMLQRVDGAISVIVSVRPRKTSSLLPGLDREDNTAGAMAATLEEARGRVHRFYPAARIVEEGKTFIVPDGALRQGSWIMFEFNDLFAGETQPVRMKIYAFCCSLSHHIYEYWFRFPAAATSADLPIVGFLNHLTWR